MAKKIITQAEQTTRFNEWLTAQKMPHFDEVVDRQRWWVNKVIEFDKLTANEYDVCPGFYVDSTGNVHYDSNPGEE